MRKPAAYVLGPTGTPFVSAGSKVFEKDVLVEGTYQHPIQPWDTPLEVTKDYIDRVCAASNAALKQGQRVYVPDGHSTKARDNVGFVSEFAPRLVDGKWRAVARFTVEDDSYLAKIGKTIRDVSPLIVTHPLGNGADVGERIAHVALVPDPVMPGQGDFVACSVGGGTLETVEVPVLKALASESPMKVKINAANVKALSLVGIEAKEGDEVEVTLAQFEKALSVANEAQTARAAAEKALADEKAKPAATPERLLSVDAKATPYFGEARTQRAKALSATLDAAQAKGKINAAMRASFEKVLSVRHGYALSETGTAETVDVVAAAESLLAAIPDNAAVPVGTALQGQGATGAERPANEPAKFDAKAAADEMLVKAGFKKPTTPETK
jgi:ribosomal 50S subunit-recycling heat shock protein